MMKNTVLNIALLGMSEKGISTFAYFIRKQSGHHLKLDTADSADIYITDFDTESGISQWHEHCRAAGKPSILISVENPVKPNTVWVKKPVVSGQLQTAIAQLIKMAETPSLDAILHEEPQKVVARPAPRLQVVEHEVQADNKERKNGYQRSFSDEHSPNLTLSRDEIVECCGAREDMRPEHTDFKKLVFFNEEKTLLASLKKAIQTAKEKHCVVYIKGLPVQFAVLPGAEKIVVELENRHLRHLCAMPMQVMPQLQSLHVTPLECEGLFPAHHQNMRSTEQVLWQMALWTARGRLPASINPAEKMQLEYWPNFTRLQITPHALHIAALWTRYSLSPLDIAGILQIPQRYVFALASAAHTTGLLQQNAQGESLMKMDWKKPNKLFSTILRSLKIA